MSRTKAMILMVTVISASVFATPHDPNDLFVRVIDCGQALCCVAEMPGGYYLIYDAGDYADGGTQTFEKIQEVIPGGSRVELLVLSHSDSDHLGAVDEICDEYTVKRVLRSGYRRTTLTWQAADQAIRLEKEQENCIDINLRYFEYPMGATYRFGDVYVTMICGFHRPPPEWGNLSQSEERNAGSIVIRLEYKGKRVLFCGDTVGRHIGAREDKCIAAEQYMVENKEVIPIDADVLVVPHHGADNASSVAFIQAVSPQYVVFSAGNRSYRHPRAIVAQRYLNNGLDINRIFRTDLGDDESLAGDDEWSYGRIQGNRDPKGDDDVDVVIRSNGTVEVAYRSH